MCDYCDCRSIEEIGELSAEHEHVLALTHVLRRGSAGDDGDAVRVRLLELRSTLERHTEREERGIFSVLADVGTEPAYRGRFLDDHAEIERSIEEAVMDPATVPRLVTLVERHVFEEETDLYPAIRQLFAPADWAEVERRRGALATPR